MNDQPFHGANAPPPPVPLSQAEIKAWLDYDLIELTRLRDERLTALTAIAAAYPRIDDDETLGEIAENIRMGRALLKTAEARRKEQKRPFLDGGRVVDAWFDRFNQPFNSPLTTIQAVINAYGIRKLEASKAAAEAAFAEAKRQADEAAERAAAALREAPAAADIPISEAAEAAEQAERAQAAIHAKPADHTRTYGEFGAVASMRTRWRYEITDFNAIPRQYLMINHDAVKFAAKTRDKDGRPSVEIPGLIWVADQSMGVR